MTTFREKLQAEHPDKISPAYNGGCALCPTHYGYEDESPYFCDCMLISDELCTECWDREIPGTKPQNRAGYRADFVYVDELETQPQGKVIYIAGPITGTKNYRGRFAEAEDKLEAAGFIVLNPTCLPLGLEHGQYLHIDKAMIDVADVVLFLPGWQDSKGASEEMDYCHRINKPNYISMDMLIMKERTR